MISNDGKERRLPSGDDLLEALQQGREATDVALGALAVTDQLNGIYAVERLGLADVVFVPGTPVKQRIRGWIIDTKPETVISDGSIAVRTLKLAANEDGSPAVVIQSKVGGHHPYYFTETRLDLEGAGEQGHRFEVA